MTKPLLTATNHMLSFEKLSPEQFERLCLWLVNDEGYQRAEHYGQSGNDQGRDVVAFKRTDDGEQRWYFQCKRYKELGAQPLKDEVDKIHRLPVAERPHGIHFVTNATLSALSRTTVEQYCRTRGYACRFWAHTELDERVKNYPRIVREFFGGKPALSRVVRLALLAIVLLMVATLWFYRRTPPVAPMTIHVNDQQGDPAVGAIVEIDALPGQQFTTEPDGTVVIKNIPRQRGDLIKIKVRKGNAKAERNLTFPNANSDVITLP